MRWSSSKSSFRMPKPHETHDTKGWYSTSWYSTNWYRFISICSLCFNLLTPFEAKNKAPAPKQKPQEQQRCSLFYSRRLSARSAFIHPPASSRNSILHHVPNFSEKQFYIYTWPGLNVYCWKTNSCADPILMTVKPQPWVASALCILSICFNSNCEISLQLQELFHGGTADRKLTSGWLHGVILNSV